MYNYNTNDFLSILYEGVYIVDKKRKIVFWNSGAENITGYLVAEVVNAHCYQNILKHVAANGKNYVLTVIRFNKLLFQENQQRIMFSCYTN